MLYEKYSNPEQMSNCINDSANDIFKNITKSPQNVEDKEKLKNKVTSSCSQNKILFARKNCRSRHNVTKRLNAMFPHRKELDDMPVIPEMRLLEETKLPIKKQIEYLSNDLQQLNYKLEHKCGIKNGFTQFLESQSDFTKEILDAYITSINLSKTDLSEKISNKNIEQKKAFHNLEKSTNISKNLIGSEDNELMDELENEKVLSVTQLEWPVPPETIPLPVEEDEDIHQTIKDEHFMSTIADIHASLVGDQSITAVSENMSITSSIKDAGECKMPRPVPDPQPLEKSSDIIETIEEQKCKRGIKSKFRSFFTRKQNRSRITISSL